jgi:hypothetical protein
MDNTTSKNIKDINKNNSNDNVYNEILFNIIANIVVLLFTIIFGLFVILTPSTNMIIKLLTIIVVICALILAINRDTYLPFLGKTVMPSSLIFAEKTPQGANVNYTILLNNAKDGTKVIYWGANSSDKNEIKTNPLEAYNNYVNAGVSTVSNGKAKITFFCPDKYQVEHLGFKSTIKRHIHYRLQCPETGIMSSVLTIYVDC